MIQQYPKRLIEVDLPIKRISAHARREKSIRHGHISTLHIWWARRPLAACRAVICASLWPDPADPLCPQDFREKASALINAFANAAVTNKALGESCDHQTWTKWQALTKSGGLDGLKEAHWNVLRFALLDFIADFANWDNSNVQEYLDTCHGLTQAAHKALGGEVGTRPLVVDPFAGGGAIPVEALRVGADAFASDLNPIPVLLNKVVTEYVPKYGQELADEVRKWGKWIKEKAEEELEQVYPRAADGEIPIAYFWSRTIISASPGTGDTPVEVPLLRSMWLSKKGSRKFALRWRRDEKGGIRTERQTIHYVNGTTREVLRPLIEVFKPETDAQVESGTSRGGSATCPVTGFTTAVEGVREQLAARRGGAGDARLLAVVVGSEEHTGRTYRIAEQSDQDGVDRALVAFNTTDPTRSPKAYLPTGHINHLRGFFNIVLYGMECWGDLFSPRQALSLTTFVRLVREVTENFLQSTETATPVQVCLALTVDRLAEKLSSVARWDVTRENPQGTFGRQALPMVWDFCEVNPFSGAGGDWDTALDWVAKVLEANVVLASPGCGEGHVEQGSATAHLLPDDGATAVITDPPYYSAVPYADLSDFFYSWLKQTVGDKFPAAFREALSPKDKELVALSHRASMYREKNAAWFEAGMTEACREMRRICEPGGIAVVVFANKETAGWEAMLSGLISAGWIITASWPIDTEMTSRLRARNSAVLSSSIHLVCRPRKYSDDSIQPHDVGDWRDVLNELPARIHEWMPRLADEGIVGADAIFACLGPALEIFSRYSCVEKANGVAVALKEYLEHVWAAVAKEALAMVFKGADVTGFESDSRLTAMWLWTLNSPDTNGNVEDSDRDTESDDEPDGKKAKASGFTLEYDAARKIAQGLGANLENLNHLVQIVGDEARLLAVSERTQHLFGKNQEEPTRITGRKKKSAQLDMFTELTESEDAEVAWSEKTVKRVGETTLDRVHQGMILFAAGRGEALKRFIVEDGVGRDGKFWGLAQALSALYPSASDEKRWVDGVLARKKQLGF
jgi:putative DNA methylase